MIFLNFDLGALIELKSDFEPKVRRVLNDAARDLALQAHAHILEDVQKKLHSSRDKYLGAMNLNQVSEDTWVITLDKSAAWIEDGMEEHEMIDDLLGSKKTKTARDGSRYLVVPFQHNKNPTAQTRAQKDLTDTIRAEMGRRKIPYGKLETNPDGTPKQGLLHSFDITKLPVKTANGPGMGHGPIGQVRQGTTNIPFLQGVRVYQKEIKDAAGKNKTVKSVMTFRVVSSKHKGSGKWIHPGLDARKFFDAAGEWALSQWETKIAPDIMRRLESVL